MTDEDPTPDATPVEDPTLDPSELEIHESPEDREILVDVVSIRSGSGMDKSSGQTVGVVRLGFANSALPDVEFPILYVGTAPQLRAAGDALRGAFRHVANTIDPDARRRR